MPGTKGFLMLLLGALAVGAAVWWLASEEGGAGDVAHRPPYRLPVTLAVVERGDIQPTIALTGSVRSARWASLAFELGGQLAELPVQEGDVLHAGQPLARLQSQDQELGVARAEADLAVAARQHELLAAGERQEVIRRLAAELEAASAGEEIASLEVDRLSNLLAESLVTQQETDRAHADHRAAVARRQAAEQRLQEAEAGSRAEDLAIAAARVAVAESVLAVAKAQLAKTTLLAPWDGAVILRRVSVGDYVSPGEDIVVVADLLHLEVDVEVPAQEALRLGTNPSVVLRLDEAPDWRVATSLDVRIEAADRASRNFRGVVRLQPEELADDVLRPGMFVRVELLLAPIEGALVVTADAVRITERGPILVVADSLPAGAIVTDIATGTGAGGGAGGTESLVGRWLAVRVVGAEAGRVAVQPLDGALAPGDTVVVTGVDLAYPGVALQPREVSAPGVPAGTRAGP